MTHIQFSILHKKRECHRDKNDFTTPRRVKGVQTIRNDPVEYRTSS